MKPVELARSISFWPHTKNMNVVLHVSRFDKHECDKIYMTTPKSTFILGILVSCATKVWTSNQQWVYVWADSFKIPIKVLLLSYGPLSAATISCGHSFNNRGHTRWTKRRDWKPAGCSRQLSPSWGCSSGTHRRPLHGQVPDAASRLLCQHERQLHLQHRLTARYILTWAVEFNRAGLTQLLKLSDIQVQLTLQFCPSIHVSEQVHDGLSQALAKRC